MFHKDRCDAVATAVASLSGRAVTDPPAVDPLIGRAITSRDCGPVAGAVRITALSGAGIARRVLKGSPRANGHTRPRSGHLVGVSLRPSGTLASVGRIQSSEVLAKFVGRARRIEAHSIAADRAYLDRLARGEIQVVVGEDGSSAQMTRSLPAEEAFESLAARLRPLLLAGESIFHEKVCDAIVEQMEAAAGEHGLAPATRAEIDRMRQNWADAALSRSAEPGYVVQMTATADGDPVTTPLLSAALLADGWLYLDLVHVDPRGDKVDAALMPLRERYAAAVYSLAQLAMMTLATLDVLRAARDVWLDVPVDAWEKDVIVGDTTIIETGTVYYADIQDDAASSADGAGHSGPNSRVTLPDMITDGVSLGPQWKVMDAEYVRALAAQFSQEPSGDGGDSLAKVEISFPSKDPVVVTAVSTGLASSTDEIRWTLVLEEALELEVLMTRVVAASSHDRSTSSAGDVDDHATIDNRCDQELTSDSTGADWTLAQVDVRHVGNSNVDTLRGLRLRAALETPGARVVLSHSEHGLMMSFAVPIEAETSTGVHDKINVFDDLVRIAELSETDVEPLEGAWVTSAEADLRRVRLLWEGQIVQYVVRLSGVATATATPPPAVIVPARTFKFANLQVPVPTLLHRHPDMACDPRPTNTSGEPGAAVRATEESVAEPKGAQTEARVVWDITVPGGEQFCTWAPSRRAVPSDDDLYAAIAAGAPTDAPN